MAYNEVLVDSINDYLVRLDSNFFQKKMFGGVCFMVNDKMCVGVVRDEMMARVGPKEYSDHLEKEGVAEMAFTGRPMKGYVFVQPEAWDSDTDLEYWIDKCLEFNPEAKASKKRVKKV